MSTVMARRVLHLLTQEMKAGKRRCCRVLLNIVKGSDGFVDHLITVVET